MISRRKNTYGDYIHAMAKPDRTKIKIYKEVFGIKALPTKTESLSALSAA
jgi:hypothetical protein